MPNDVEQLTSKPEGTLRVGFLGLLYRSWLETTALDSKKFKLEKVFSLGKEMSEMLKKRFKCDLVVGITHMTNNEDMNMQNQHSNIDLRNSAKSNRSFGRSRACLLVPEIRQFGAPQKWRRFQNVQ